MLIAPSAALMLIAAAPLEIPHQRLLLANGLEVILHVDHRVPLVAIDVWVHAGSGDETVGKTGFAHLFEHMMFQGAEHIGEDVHFDVLREIGASNVNGTTNTDRTNYFEVVPKNQLETALWLESDRLGFLLPTLSEKSLQNQRDVVRNERRQRYDNVPYGRERFALAAALYPEGHPYRYLTIGKHEDIEAGSVADVSQFFRHWYTPKNVTLTIAGDIDVAETHALVKRYFGTLAGTPRPPKTVVAAPVLQKNERVEVKDAFAALTRLHWSWHSPARFTPDDTALNVFADVIGAPGWGRLHRRLVVDEPLAQDVNVMQWGKGLSGQFDIVVTLKPGSDPTRVEAVVREVLMAATAAPPSAAEINRSVVGIESGLLFSLEDLFTRADMLQTFNHYTGDPNALAGYLADVRGVTPQRAWAAARRTLLKPRVLIVTVPEKRS
jgi:predicted Zn-dependent peptidase